MLALHSWKKNKNEVPQGIADIMSSSTSNSLLVHLSSSIGNASSSSFKKRPSIVSQFSKQLSYLIKRIESTTPHYIRCIKPNEDLLPSVYDCAVVGDQLKCNGVLEAIRIARLGFPQRYSHSAFLDRYQRVLGTNRIDNNTRKRKKSGKSMNSNILRGECINLVKQIADRYLPSYKAEKSKSLLPLTPQGNSVRMARDKLEQQRQLSMNSSSRSLSSVSSMSSVSSHIGIQVGKSKVFLCQKAFDLLESILGEEQKRYATIINNAARRFLAVRALEKLRLEAWRAFEAANESNLKARRKIEQEMAIAAEKELRHREMERKEACIHRGAQRDVISLINNFKKNKIQKQKSPRKYKWKQVGANWIQIEWVDHRN